MQLRSDSRVPGPAGQVVEVGRRFKPSRAGLINIWDYTDEEFVFADGRLVLRGHNGSGKTKALEVLFPFVLDGVVDARRLDPFSGENRTMKSNLLYRGQESEHGFVWMEFADGARTVTLVIALHAHKDRPEVKRAYFVTDKRLGVDFGLLTGDSRPLTERQLKAVLGPGAWHNNPTDYREAVDAALFGLGRERYTQLLDLLLALRRPLLAKDLDPAKVSDTLTAGLSPVSDELVEQASRDFENLAAVQRLMDDLAAADGAARAFLERYGGYLRVAARAHLDRVRVRTEQAVRHAAAVSEASAEARRAEAAQREAEEAAGAAAAERNTLEGTLEGLKRHEAYTAQGELESTRRLVAQGAQEIARAREANARAAEHIAQLRGEAEDVERRLGSTREAALRLATAKTEAAELAGITPDATPLVEDADGAGGSVDGAAALQEVRAQAAARLQDVEDVRLRLGKAREAERERARADEAARRSRQKTDDAERACDDAEEGVGRARVRAEDELRAWAARWSAEHAAPDAGTVGAAAAEALAAALARAGEAGAPSLAEVFGDLTEARRTTLAAGVAAVEARLERVAAETRRLTTLRDEVAAECDRRSPPAVTPTGTRGRARRCGGSSASPPTSPPARRRPWRAPWTRRACSPRGSTPTPGTPPRPWSRWNRTPTCSHIPARARRGRSRPWPPRTDRDPPPYPPGGRWRASSCPRSRTSYPSRSCPRCSARSRWPASSPSPPPRPRSARAATTASASRWGRGPNPPPSTSARPTARPGGRRGSPSTGGCWSPGNATGRRPRPSARRSGNGWTTSAGPGPSCAAWARRSPPPWRRSRSGRRCWPPPARSTPRPRPRSTPRRPRWTPSGAGSGRPPPSGACRPARRRSRRSPARSRTTPPPWNASCGVLGVDAGPSWPDRSRWEEPERAVTEIVERLSGCEPAEAVRSVLPDGAVELLALCEAATVGRQAGEAARKTARDRMSEALKEFDDALTACEEDYRLDWEQGESVVVVRVHDADGRHAVAEFARRVAERAREQGVLLEERERTVLEDELLAGLARQISDRVSVARELVKGMDADTRSRPMSTGTTVGIRWVASDKITDLQWEVSALLEQDGPGADRLAELRRLIRQMIREYRAGHPRATYKEVLFAVLDYRAWRSFELRLKVPGEDEVRLSKKRHSQMSGGEKSAAIHLPLFAAANALYSSASGGCPRMIALDEAFAGIDDVYKPDLLGLTVRYDLDVFMTGHDLWARYETVPAAAHYDMHSDKASHTVSAMLVLWDGCELVDSAAGFSGNEELAKELLGFAPTRRGPLEAGLLEAGLMTRDAGPGED
ncbi:SbcC/MukB-like Walker B domain-containing protein [Sphaerisporangium sp. NPDC051017]|uniref:SbcC/MukB-like Walker B domain-containing protein n=1 Tax=Sphaerisporangium sp. NPDC051017 TaxID=3154636 RepID=UPI00341FE454